MLPTHCLILLLGLGACASAGHRTSPARTDSAGPTLSGSLPAAQTTPQSDGPGAPQETTLPIGVGLSSGPSAVLVGATLDFPLDKQLTFGPSLQYGFDDDISLLSATGQLKYFLRPIENESGSFSVLPYITAGVGLASIDKDGRSRDSGLLLDGGAGLRFLTGDHYRIGSEARLNVMPDKVADERTFLTFELLQVVISF